MWETYRMLGQAREEELMREATRLHQLSSRGRRQWGAGRVWARISARTRRTRPVERWAGLWAAIRGGAT
ncbi:MAG: hypothetical protein QOE36_3251 [Gaiellaceae bacterium]|nr:hypothetical protein [Gaiellaceae bacterium]